MSPQQVLPVDEKSAVDTSTIFAVLSSQGGLVEEIGARVVAQNVRGNILVFGSEIPATLTLYASSVIMEVFQKERSESTARVADVTYPFIPLEIGDAKAGVLHAGQVQPKSWTAGFIVNVLSDLTYFANCVGGITFNLYAPTMSCFHEPFQDVEKVFHLFIGTLPHNDHEVHYPEKRFGISLKTEEGYRQHFMGARGRGKLLYDETQEFAQIIGNNIYLLFDPFFLIEDNEETGFEVFRRAMSRICAYILAREGNNEDATVPALTEQMSIEEAIDKYTEQSLAGMERVIAKEINKIREAEDALLALKKGLRDSWRLRDLIVKNDFCGADLRKHLLTDHERITRHPLTEDVQIDTQGWIIVTTKTIYITHDGCRRKIGEYIIRLSIGGHISIWTKVTHHPKSVPHPHISAWSGYCFGTMDSAIKDALLECRFGDVMDYIYDWLTEGYSPELVIYNKIDEWPIVDANQEEHSNEQ
jgi:hypothetical protein